MKTKIQNADQFKAMLSDITTLEDVKKALDANSFGAYKQSFLNACQKQNGIDVSSLIGTMGRKSAKKTFSVDDAFKMIADYLKDFPQDIQDDFSDLKAKIEGEKARVERKQQIAELEKKLAELKAVDAPAPSSLLETADKKSKSKK